MSLAIGLTGADGVVLAADSRGTIGDPRGLTAMNDTMQKLFQLTRASGCAVFGSAEMGLAILTNFKAWSQDFARSGECVDDLPVEEVAKYLTLVSREAYAGWFPSFPPPARPELGIVVGGLDASGEPAVFVLLSNFEFTALPSPSGFSFGGVVNYAVYLAHRFYDRNMRTTSLSQLAEYLIYETSTQDPKVGGPIKIAIINRELGYRQLGEDQVSELRVQNARLSRDLAKSFAGA